MYYTYILRSERFKRFYIGSTNNIEKRLSGHNAGNTQSTKPFRPWKLLYSEECSTLPEARKREQEIKAWKNPQYMLKALHLED
jgi:putative endonuclease